MSYNERFMKIDLNYDETLIKDIENRVKDELLRDFINNTIS